MSEYLKQLGVEIEELENVQGRGKKAKRTESLNYAEMSLKLQKYGLETMWVRDDWHGADMIAYHPDPSKGVCLWIQLKSRITIKRQYINKGNLCIAFKHTYTCKKTKTETTDWYLIPHNKLLEIVPESWQKSDSWVTRGIYHAASPSSEILPQLSSYKI